MWEMRERLKRIFVIILAALLIMGAVKFLAGWKGQVEISEKPADLSEAPVKEKLEDLGGEILGRSAEILQGISTESKEGESQETEPIEEPVKSVQSQTEVLLEMIKKLPEDQLEAVKEQLYQEICEETLEE